MRDTWALSKRSLKTGQLIVRSEHPNLTEALITMGALDVYNGWEFVATPASRTVHIGAYGCAGNHCPCCKKAMGDCCQHCPQNVAPHRQDGAHGRRPL